MWNSENFKKQLKPFLEFAVQISTILTGLGVLIALYQIHESSEEFKTQFALSQKQFKLSQQQFDISKQQFDSQFKLSKQQFNSQFDLSKHQYKLLNQGYLTLTEDYLLCSKDTSTCPNILPGNNFEFLDVTLGFTNQGNTPVIYRMEKFEIKVDQKIVSYSRPSYDEISYPKENGSYRLRYHINNSGPPLPLKNWEKLNITLEVKFSYHDLDDNTEKLLSRTFKVIIWDYGVNDDYIRKNDKIPR